MPTMKGQPLKTLTDDGVIGSDVPDGIKSRPGLATDYKRLIFTVAKTRL